MPLMRRFTLLAAMSAADFYAHDSAPRTLNI